MLQPSCKLRIFFQDFNAAKPLACRSVMFWIERLRAKGGCREKMDHPTVVGNRSGAKDEGLN